MTVARIRSVAILASAFAMVMVLLAASTPWNADAGLGPEESTVVAVTPARILDTRDPTNLGLPGPFVSPVAQKFQVTGSVPTATGTMIVVPTGATGVLLNVSSINSTADGFISIRPGDATGAPTTSSLNFTAGQTVPNAVQVAMPTTGANAGEIDITYDALGVAGPTTDIFIDVVGYTTNAGLKDVVTHGEITMGYGHDFTAGTPPPTLGIGANVAAVGTGGSGVVLMNLEGPAEIGGVGYGLKSVSYCIEGITVPGFVTNVNVQSTGPQPSDLSTAIDFTDRTEVGCYTLAVNNRTGTSHYFVVGLGGGGVGGVRLNNVTAVWAPASMLP